MGIPPCRYCGSERVPGNEVTIMVHPCLAPLIAQRIDEGLCVACAKREVEDLYADGKITVCDRFEPARGGEPDQQDFTLLTPKEAVKRGVILDADRPWIRPRRPYPRPDD